MNIHIHKMEDDTGEILSFCHEMIEASYYPAYSREATDRFLKYHSRESVMADAAGGRIWAAREGGRLVGTVTVANGELTRMFVLPSLRGKGLGALLAGEALAYAQESGVKKLTAWSVPFSRGFYEKLGFCMLNADLWNFENTRDPAVPYIEMALWPQGAPDIKIMLAEGPDGEEMLAGQREAFEEQCRIYDHWDIPPMTEQTEDFIAFLEGGGVVLKAVSGGRIIGAIRGKVVGGVCQVGRLYVLPQWQGWSISRRLIAALEEETQQCGAFSIFTGERSEKNIALYTRQGYALTGRRAPAKAPGSTGNYDLVWQEKPNPWPEISECARRFRST